MKKIPILLTLISFLTSCEKNKKSDWLENSLSEIRSIDPADTNFTDLESLKKAIGNSKVVLLGEQEHGDGSTYSAKSRLVKFLHDEMGFTILAFESDFFGVNKAWEDYQRGKKDYQDVINQLYTFWSQSQMCENLFQTIKESQSTQNPIVLAGFDNRQITNVSQEELLPSLDSIIREHNIPISILDLGFFKRTLKEAMNKLHDQEITPENQARFLSIIDTLTAEFQKEGIDSFWVQELKNTRGFIMYVWHWWIDRENDLVDNNLRDIQMANNCLWLLNEKYQGEKMIIWAANGHVIKTDTLFDVEAEGWKPAIRQYPMGEILFNSLGEEMYSIGFTSYKGKSTSLQYDSAAQNFIFQSYPFEPADSTSFEFELKQRGLEYAFIDLPEQLDLWTTTDQRIRVWRPEYVKGKLPTIYDGIFYIHDMHPNKKL
ncbi:erythromycin esterase family protein [Tunicatimonas pelagia]|uniref:erythromycin esterase family protein n=1 Tax=Tunicatimonas pelagia TaxID=931531 RepID=UPI0026671F7C|nr:erythromycin esterase family protein [Tunicatimonas pelagia]WKN45908.1 erythromycin esterase family protein [Tunicatimonas pelagia]